MMRSLCLLLLLVNALAWAFQHWVLLPDERVAATHVTQDYPRLNAMQRPAAAPAPPAPEPEPAAAGVSARCLRIGPIEVAASAGAIAERLGNRGITVRVAEQPARLWVGHWVQIVGLADRPAADAARGRLVAAGIADAYIVTGGDELKISLGVFKGEDSAERVMARAGELGFRTRMEERYQDGTAWWLDVRLAEGMELRQGELLGSNGSILRTEPVPCVAAETVSP